MTSKDISNSFPGKTSQFFKISDFILSLWHSLEHGAHLSYYKNIIPSLTPLTE